MSNKTINQTMSAIFELLKRGGGDYSYDVAKTKVNSDYFQDAISHLIKVHKLVVIVNNFFVLTQEGEKHDTFDAYLQSLNKKDGLSLYQKIYLIFFVSFGLFGVYKVFQPSVSVKEFESLERHIDSLNVKFDFLEKEMSVSTSKLLNDTLQTKKIDSSFVD